MKRLPLLFGLFLIAIPCSLGSTQAPTPVDSGTFTMTSITPMGTRTSTEEFTIVRNADGGFTMTNVSSGDRKMRSVLTTDSLGVPLAYEHHGKGGEAVEKTYTSKREGGGPMVLSELSTRNPPRAPFQFSANTLLFGEGGLALAWFLGLVPAPAEVSYFEVSLWRLEKAQLSVVGTESVVIDGAPIAATHLSLVGGLFRRDIWLDSQKRLLQVSIHGGAPAVRTKRPS